MNTINDKRNKCSKIVMNIMLFRYDKKQQSNGFH